MYNFFINQEKIDDKYIIEGENYNHIANVLRMKVGDSILISQNGSSNLCQIIEISNKSVIANILEENYLDTELPVKIKLFQGLPKADKLEVIIQKAVELGVYQIVPVETSRSIVKIDVKKKDSKTERWQKISESAAKQCKRNIIPIVSAPITFKEGLKEMESLDMLFIPYENKNGMQDTINSLSKIKKGMTIGVFIGPEGGISDSEIDSLNKLKNSNVISLGKRILRTETASLTALSMLMLYIESKFN